MKIIRIISRILFIVAIPLMLLSASIAWGTNSLWLYQYGFEKYNVSQSTGLAPSELQKAATGLIGYFNSSEEYISVQVIKGGKTFELFTREEAIHFKDVKQLFRLDYLILIVSAVYFLGYGLFYLFRKRNRDYRYLAGSIAGGSILTLVIMIIAGVSSFFDFDQLFLQFHYIAFSNQFWSATGYMLLLFPGGFWFDAAMIIAGAATGTAMVMAAISIWYVKANQEAVTGKNTGN